MPVLACLVLGACLPFFGCSSKSRQFGDLHLVAAPQALLRMELSPILKQAPSMSWSRMRQPTVAVEGRRVIHLTRLEEEPGRFRLEVMPFGGIQASGRFRLRETGADSSSMGFFISTGSGYLVVALRWTRSGPGGGASGLVVQAVDRQGVEQETIGFTPLKLAQDEWVELGIRSEKEAVVATVAGRDFSTPLEGLAADDPVDVGLAVDHAEYLVDQLRVGTEEIAPRRFESMVLLATLKDLSAQFFNPDFRLGDNPLAVTKGNIGGEYRDALMAVPRSLFEFTVEVGQRTELAFAVGCFEWNEVHGDRLTRFSVQVVDAGGAVHDVFSLIPGNTAHYGDWRDCTVDLSEFRNTTATLRFATDVPGGTGNENWDIAYWGDPRLRLPDPPPVEKLNVVLISLDQLRPDHLRCYGYPHRTSPFIDSVAAQSVVFENAFSHAPWTLPSHMSLMTGLPVGFHGVTSQKHIPPPELHTLAESFAAAGYRTAGYTGDAAVAGWYGFFQGFQRYFDDVFQKDRIDWTAEIMKRTDSWLTEEGDQPFFLFFHTYETHPPYTHAHLLPDSLKSIEVQLGSRNEAAGVGRYDSGIDYVDWYMRELWAALERTGALSRTIIALTSDHGAELFDRSDHLMTHPHSLHRDVLQVMLILNGPGIPRGLRAAEVVGLEDVAPTLLELCGLPVPESMRGRSLIPLMHGEKAEPRTVFSVYGNDDVLEPRSVVFKEHHLILHMEKYKENAVRAGLPEAVLLADEEPVQLYNYLADPNEMHNLAKELPAKVVELNRMFERHREQVSAANVQAGRQFNRMDDETLRQLRALGYVN
ncbi:MAG: sulfatase [Candidatus Glassbacteria bacterium]|nr:sulfatase [Candidatus Glassbacteria bacterium]